VGGALTHPLTSSVSNKMGPVAFDNLVPRQALGLRTPQGRMIRLIEINPELPGEGASGAISAAGYLSYENQCIR
jgi:hypothetical protein